MGTATTPATTPAQKIRIYRYIKVDRGDVFSTRKRKPSSAFSAQRLTPRK